MKPQYPIASISTNDIILVEKAREFRHANPDITHVQIYMAGIEALSQATLPKD